MITISLNFSNLWQNGLINNYNNCSLLHSSDSFYSVKSLLENYCIDKILIWVPCDLLSSILLLLLSYDVCYVGPFNFIIMGPSWVHRGSRASTKLASTLVSHQLCRVQCYLLNSCNLWQKGLINIIYNNIFISYMLHVFVNSTL